jgi:hypothetical protein
MAIIRRMKSMLPRLGFLLIGLVLSLVVINVAGAQDASELGRIFDAYNAAAKAGDVDKMLSLRTAEQQKEIRGQITKKEDRDVFVLLARAQIPESYRTEHVSWAKSGKSATLYLLGQFAAMPKIQRPRMRMEESLSFKKEDGQWKFDLARPLGEPDKIKRPKDLTRDPKDANLNASGSIGGRIVKTEFKPDYTLVLLRVMDEENAVFLPAKAVLEKAGVPLSELVPWQLYEFKGHPHKTDKLKFFATSGHPIKE